MWASSWSVLALGALVASAAGFACSSADLMDGSGGRYGDGEAKDCYENFEDCSPEEREAARAARDAGPTKPLIELPPPTSAVTIQVQPTDKGTALLSALRGAQKSIHLTIYLLTNNDVIDALGDMKEAGRDVKVVLNQRFPESGGNQNQAAYDKLVARGVEVSWASSSFNYTHSKTLIIDSAKVIIMTMNLTYSSASTNREYIATDTDPTDVADAEKLFDADFARRPVTLESKLVVSPAGANAIDPRDMLSAFIASAKTSLDVEVQSLSDYTIVDSIVKAKQAGVETRVVVDGDYLKSEAAKKALAALKAGGVEVRSMSSPDVHAKVVVVDGERVFVGSQNFTSTALTKNREVGVIAGSQAEAAKVRGVIAGDWSAGAAL